MLDRALPDAVYYLITYMMKCTYKNYSYFIDKAIVTFPEYVTRQEWICLNPHLWIPASKEGSFQV